MKKLFVSVPMKKRTTEEILDSVEKMHKIAEAIVGEELELIDSFIPDNAPENSKQALWYLGKSLEKLAEADIFISVEDRYDFNGCYIEAIAAQRYNIQSLFVDARWVITDFTEYQSKLWEEQQSVPVGVVPCIK